MRVLILAAGQSRRFKEAGYAIPKPFLPIEWRGRIACMLDHVVSTIPVGFNIVIAAPRGYVSYLHEQYREIEDSKGPADTALQALRTLNPPIATLIIDVDILNHTNDLIKLSKLNHCAVLVKRSANPAYSYVDALGTFHHIVEKQRISDYAVQGAYFIPDHAMEETMKEMKRAVEVEREPYMSHVFDKLTLMKYSIHTTYTPVDWGTPNDLVLSGARICM